jgi:hypothetical protein
MMRYADIHCLIGWMTSWSSLALSSLAAAVRRSTCTSGPISMGSSTQVASPVWPFS